MAEQPRSLTTPLLIRVGDAGSSPVSIRTVMQFRAPRPTTNSPRLTSPFSVFLRCYLIYAEADARLNGGNVTDETAKGYIRQLRQRAGVDATTPSIMNLNWLLDERARELMWEGHRRVDLIRYDYFTSMQFPWTLKGGVPNGKIALPDYRTIYPIIISDLNANPKLVQNPGY